MIIRTKKQGAWTSPFKTHTEAALILEEMGTGPHRRLIKLWRESKMTDDDLIGMHQLAASLIRPDLTDGDWNLLYYHALRLEEAMLAEAKRIKP